MFISLDKIYEERDYEFDFTQSCLRPLSYLFVIKKVYVSSDS